METKESPIVTGLLIRPLNVIVAGLKPKQNQDLEAVLNYFYKNYPEEVALAEIKKRLNYDKNKISLIHLNKEVNLTLPKSDLFLQIIEKLHVYVSANSYQEMCEEVIRIDKGDKPYHPLKFNECAPFLFFKSECGIIIRKITDYLNYKYYFLDKCQYHLINSSHLKSVNTNSQDEFITNVVHDLISNGQIQMFQNRVKGAITNYDIKNPTT